MAFTMRCVNRSGSKIIDNYLNSNYYRTVTTVKQLKESEYTDVPEYVDVFDPSNKGRKLTERLKWYETIRKLPTVEQKFLEINNNYPKRVIATIVNPENVTYNALKFSQYCTRTHVIHGLPQDYYSNVADILERVREPIIDSVKDSKRKYDANPEKSNHYKEIILTNDLLNEIVFLITSALGCEKKHIATAEVIENPRCDSFWWHSDYYHRYKLDSFIDVCFQFEWKPSTQLRINKPLPTILDRDDPMCKSNELPNCLYHPAHYKLSSQKRAVTAIPGVWSSNALEFPFLTLSHLASLNIYRGRYGNDTKDAVISKGIFASFGWLMGIAANLGFTPYDELQYPLVTQTVLTNGKEWWFFVYQMNTMALHKDTNPQTHRNIMWYSGPLNLYESVEDGIYKGVDDSVIKLLLQFFVRKPMREVNFKTKPYLQETEMSQEEMKELRQKLHRTFDNRPDPYRPKYEVPTWHHIYKRNKEARPSPQVKLW